MTAARIHIAVTSAAGLVGSHLVKRPLTEPAFADARISLSDLAVPPSTDPRVRAVPGDVENPVVRAKTTAQFGRQPPLSTPLADGLGFVRDGDLATLVARVLEGLET